jgi:hypothetical protein
MRAEVTPSPTHPGGRHFRHSRTKANVHNVEFRPNDLMTFASTWIG